MEISLRLKAVAQMVDSCHCAADIGTDHGYIPIYLIKNHICNRAIASDINVGPIKRAILNVKFENLDDKIDCRIGEGLSTINPGEAEEVVIAGMGGNLIVNIIESHMEVFEESNSFILQPMQNSEVLREYIYKKGFKIIDEELCIDENRFYEIMKIGYDTVVKKVDSIFYEVGRTLVEKKHKYLSEFVEKKIENYSRIILNIKGHTELANKRKLELQTRIKRLQELI
ncbi:MAG: class I SAM-dependent methyltransferase [Clostridium luticellarii]|jgi:tRNA (adenine22-N1)-methyltransferase|uniref:tRNA (Adenine(22)-N(1))-methyltransferase n=1 Tax=Clostridium luticellarii TaxID=1691940 RepID=A0A2T0BAV7_9CLOT|nr:class I SAM-dependent methyltransferase [Clostridium luticellarii]MCI1944091.1 class I SAM-dependent methyltransferase [Clostridium luticellarii]MCI1995178.1 class I SAM-dependent methyltransferase [Clostridium luticellarii]MCI2039326.1 class I SAM-dependent methyltransferase [Clostridium luticellarii]PRR80982.1 tRNA (adenine(22)-N(1))-methyltransferase [Clostridium luticellarii]